MEMSFKIDSQVTPAGPQAASHCDAGVVIPVYNRATVILATLESVARQTLKPRKLIVVDDGSTDGTADAVAAWAQTIGNALEVELLRGEHQSAAAARNLGFSRLGDLSWTAFLDSDDCWPANFLERTTALLASDPRAVAASADRKFVDAQGREIQFDDCRSLAEDAVAWFFRNGAGVASSTLFRTSAVQKAGEWCSAHDSGEDSRVFTMIALEGPWRHAPGEPVVFHHGNASDRHEEGNLSKRYADAFRRWAGAFEEIYEALGDRYPASRKKELRHGVAGYWYRAGKQLDALGRTREAQQCYARAVRWRPTMFRAWSRLRFAA